MYGLPDSWAGGVAQRVVANKGGSRKVPISDFENMEGWLGLIVYWRAQRQAKKQAQLAAISKQKDEAPPKFTPKEEKEQRVRFRVVDED